MKNNKNLQNDIEYIKARLRQIEMRIIAVKALEDSGAGIDEELAELLSTVNTMKENQQETEVLLILEKLQEAIEANIGYMEARKTVRMLNLPEIDEAWNEIHANQRILSSIPPAAKLESLNGKPVEVQMELVAKKMQQVIELLQNQIQPIKDFVNSPKWDNLTQLFPDIEYYFNTDNPENPLSILFLVDVINNIDGIHPFIKEEVTKAKKERGVNSIGFLDFVRDTDPATGEKVKSIFEICLERAAAEKRSEHSIHKPEIEAIKHILPVNYVMISNAISNSLSKTRKDPETGEMVPVINSGAFNLPVMRSGKSGEVTAYVMITLDHENDLTMDGKPFTRYDNCVLNAIATLWEAGNEIVTPESIARAMANRTKSEYISPQQQGAITKSIEKMRHIYVYADVSQEARIRKVKDEDGDLLSRGLIIDNWLLIMDRIRVKVSGRERAAYIISQEPPLLKYSKMIGRAQGTGQLITVKADLMDIKKIGKGGTLSTMSVSNNETRQQIKEYLLQRIEVMKYARKNKHGNQSNRILFETLYSEVNIPFTKTETLRTRKYVFQALDYWNAKGYINGYEIVKAGSQIRAVDIKF